MYVKSPAAPTAPPRPAIPFCDEEWIKQWRLMKGPYRPHVVTVNMADKPGGLLRPTVMLRAAAER